MFNNQKRKTMSEFIKIPKRKSPLKPLTSKEMSDFERYCRLIDSTTIKAIKASSSRLKTFNV